MRNEPWVWLEVRDAGTSGAGAVPLRSAQLMGQQKKKKNVAKECLVLDIVSVKRDDGETVSSFMLFLSKEMMVKLSHSLCGFCRKRRWRNCLLLYVVSVQRDDGETVSFFMLFLPKEMMVTLSHPLYCFCQKR